MAESSEVAFLIFIFEGLVGEVGVDGAVEDFDLVCESVGVVFFVGGVVVGVAEGAGLDGVVSEAHGYFYVGGYGGVGEGGVGVDVVGGVLDLGGDELKGVYLFGIGVLI